MSQFEMLWSCYEAATRRMRRARVLGVKAPYVWADYLSAKRALEDFLQTETALEDEYFERIQALNRK